MDNGTSSAEMADEKGAHIQVICSGLLAQWRLIVHEQGSGDLCDLRFSLEEVGQLFETLLKTAAVLDERHRAELIGRVGAALFQLEPSFQFSVRRRERE